MPYWIVAIALLALAGLVLLVLYAARDGAPKTRLWALLMVLAFPLALLSFNITSIYFRPPVVWIALTITTVVAAWAFFVLAGRGVRWKLARVLALVGSMFLAVIAATAVLMIAPGGQVFVPLFETRAQQMAEAHGFETLLAPDEELFTDYLPVTELEEDGGFAIMYRRFDIQQRAADGELSEADLRAVAAPGEDPVGWGRGIPADATYEELEVDGRPALGVEYRDDGGPMPKAQSVIRLLVFEKDGVDVRMVASGHNEYQGERGREEAYEYLPPLTFDELLAIAETLQPKPD